jgi:hypothetical protein
VSTPAQAPRKPHTRRNAALGLLALLAILALALVPLRYDEAVLFLGGILAVAGLIVATVVVLLWTLIAGHLPWRGR